LDFFSENHMDDRKASLFLFLFLAVLPPAVAGESLVIAWWNMENAFDTVNNADPLPRFGRDDEFTPEGAKNWTGQRYDQKLKNMATAIRSMHQGAGPDILGMCEVENEGVVHDLVTRYLTDLDYAIAYHESPDARGIDVGFIYKRNRLTQLSLGARVVPSGEGESPTRDVVFVEFRRPDGTLVCIGNHWPSRRGGAGSSERRRIDAAKTCRAVVDSILRLNPAADVVVMGDFNDLPGDVSITRYLGAIGDSSRVRQNPDLLYNCMSKWSGDTTAGTYLYRRAWNMLDQFMVSPGMLDMREFHLEGVEIHDAGFLKETSGRYAGAPFPTYGGSNYLGGYSDHFPILLRVSVGPTR
jgi:predicted extracellular nuclease